jgi:hypothetical protein
MSKSSRRFLLFLSLALGLSVHATSSACAHPVGPQVPYSVTAEDEWGNELRAFHKADETFLLGSYGRRYNLRVRNQTGRRVEAVVTVDGRDVVSGRIGDFKRERGYLIDPYSDVLVEGFRTSLEDVAAFRFAAPEESYSSRMGTPQNVGVIGVAIFPERVVPVHRRPMPLYDRPHAPPSPMDDMGSSYGPARKSAASGRAAGVGTMSADAPSASAAESSGTGYATHAEAQRSKGNLGTEYGESHASHVREVEFRRASATQPSQVIVLRYDDEEGLLARGFRLHEPPVVSYAPREPNPFPHSRFAPPPP